MCARGEWGVWSAGVPALPAAKGRVNSGQERALIAAGEGQWGGVSDKVAVVRLPCQHLIGAGQAAAYVCEELAEAAGKDG